LIQERVDATDDVKASECPIEPVRLPIACLGQDAHLIGEDEPSVDDDGLAHVLNGQASLEHYASRHFCLLIWGSGRATA
jgi:hypothetical protein